MQLKNKLKWIAMCSFAFLSLITMPIAVAASVKIINSGFEDRFYGWIDIEPSAISNEEYSGSRAAKITGEGGRFEQEITVKVNTNYKLTAYIKGSGKIGVTMGNTSHTNTATGKDYKKVTVSFNSGSFTLITIFGVYNGDTGRFDNFRLKSDSFWF